MKSSELEELVTTGKGQAKILNLNLALAMTDREFNLAGNEFGVWNSPTAADQITVKFNEQSAGGIIFKRGKVIRTTFIKFYITVPAGLTGNMEIVYGEGLSSIFGIAPNMGDGNEDIINQLQGDTTPEGYGQTAVGVAAVNVIPTNATRKSCSIQAALGNAGTIYVGFDNLVAANNCVAELEPGDVYAIDDYRGDIYCISSAAGDDVNFGEV